MSNKSKVALVVAKETFKAFPTNVTDILFTSADDNYKLNNGKCEEMLFVWNKIDYQSPSMLSIHRELLKTDPKGFLLVRLSDDHECIGNRFNNLFGLHVKININKRAVAKAKKIKKCGCPSCGCTAPFAYRSISGIRLITEVDGNDMYSVECIKCKHRFNKPVKKVK